LNLILENDVQIKPSPRILRLLEVILLSHPEPVYGYSLTHTSGISPAHLYPLLIRLEEAGVMSSEKVKSAFGPERRAYRLNPKLVNQLKDFVLESRRKEHETKNKQPSRSRTSPSHPIPLLKVMAK
jgi:DNA-binding PadR family transcriptional regulator